MFHCDLKKKFFWDPLEHTGIYYKLNQNNLKREQFTYAVVGKDFNYLLDPKKVAHVLKVQ